MKKYCVFFVMLILIITLPACQNPTIGSTMISDKDGMVLLYVPAGKFTMGDKSEDALAECQKVVSFCSLSWFTNEQPPHEVNLSAFWIDQTEVTNSMYAKCVREGICKQPTYTSSFNHSIYYGASEFDNYPVINVDWYRAKAYCEWAGRHLPTEAQWEKAASWDETNQTKRVYPWGNAIDCSFANYYDRKNDKFCARNGDTTAVKSYERGKSFYGAYDMAGNVSEWVSDWYDDTYYSKSPYSNPLGSDGGLHIVSIRGGTWADLEYNVRSAYRHPDARGYSDYYIGFRCSRSP